VGIGGWLYQWKLKCDFHEGTPLHTSKGEGGREWKTRLRKDRPKHTSKGKSKGPGHQSEASA
jgi:hypothetical protein